MSMSSAFFVYVNNGTTLPVSHVPSKYVYARSIIVIVLRTICPPVHAISAAVGPSANSMAGKDFQGSVRVIVD